MIQPPKKGKLIGGIILVAMGVIGLGGSGSSQNMLAGYLITCFVFIAIGIILLMAYRKSRKEYYEAVKEAQTQVTEAQKLEEAKRALEKARIDAELRNLHADANQMRICPNCGGNTKGEICEYCGSRLN